MYKSIVHSCDTYYYVLASELGVDAMHDFMTTLNLGRPTGIDLQGEMKGTLPSTEWKRTSYRKKEQQKWYAGETISLGIGQGYNNFTMLQLAQAQAIVAAGGKRFTPHLVRRIEHYDNRKVKPLPLMELEPLRWKPEHVAVIRNAYYGVTQEGTSARSFVNAPYKSGGKTGTSQVIAIKAGEKYNASKIDERHRDHALYTAFGPLESPRVAIALVVENAGFGGANAAPIARRVLDYVLSGVYPSEADIAAVRLGQATAPIGVPRPIDSVPLRGVTVDGASTVQGPGPGPRAAGVALGAAVSAVFEQPGTLAARPADLDRLRRPARCGDHPARWRRARHDGYEKEGCNWIERRGGEVIEIMGEEENGGGEVRGGGDGEEDGLGWRRSERGGKGEGRRGVGGENGG
jgi:penicillin-binding protein 2